MLKNKSINQNTKQKFNIRSDNQEFYYTSLSGIFLGSRAREELIEKEINKLKKSQSFLEVGCAQGFYLKKALKKTNKVYGIDINSEFIKKAKKTGAQVKIASGEKLPYKSNFFDYVLCTETLEHIPNWKKAISEIKRVMKKKGKIIITIPLEKSFFWKFFSIIYPPEETRGHINLLTSKDMLDEFSSFKLKNKQFIQTMSKSLNKILPQSEGISMYVFLVFEK